MQRGVRAERAEVEEAREVIAAFEAAQAEGRGVATLNGRLVENLHVDTARKVIATAAAIAALGRRRAPPPCSQRVRSVSAPNPPRVQRRSRSAA